MERISRASYFAVLALTVSSRSTCLRRNVGAIIVTPDNNIIATGYNGPPSHYPHCETCAKGELPSGQGLDVCPAIHAEANAIARAARSGASTKGCSIITTLEPCIDCLKLCINAGIFNITFLHSYPGARSELYQNIIDLTGITVIGPTAAKPINEEE